MKRIYKKMSLVLTLLVVASCAKKINIYTLCRDGDAEGLSKILSESPELINCQKDSRNWTPLHYSIYYSQYTITKLLISKGANVNLRNTYGETGLHLAAFNSDFDTVQLLLDAGAEVNAIAIPPDRLTPLDMAIEAGKNLTLVKNRPPDSIKNYDPTTPQKLKKTEENLRKLVELLKKHDGKRGAEL